MEQFLFSNGTRLASFTGMKDYIIPGAERGVTPWLLSYTLLPRPLPFLFSSLSSQTHLYLSLPLCFMSLRVVLSAGLWDSLAYFTVLKLHVTHSD